MFCYLFILHLVFWFISSRWCGGLQTRSAATVPNVAIWPELHKTPGTLSASTPPREIGTERSLTIRVVRPRALKARQWTTDFVSESRHPSSIKDQTRVTVMTRLEAARSGPVMVSVRPIHSTWKSIVWSPVKCARVRRVSVKTCTLVAPSGPVMDSVRETPRIWNITARNRAENASI